MKRVPEFLACLPEQTFIRKRGVGDGEALADISAKDAILCASSKSLLLSGMEERVCRLETELARQVGAKQEDETSTDGGIESGTEADDLSEKLI